MKKVGIIIVNFNGQKYLPDLLGSIFSNPPKTLSQTIIIVDNASTDNSLSWLRQNYPAAVILAQNENVGFAQGSNTGISWAIKHGCDYVFLLNYDTILTAGCLDLLVSAMESDVSIAAVQPTILLWPQTELVNSLGNVIHYLGFGYTYGHKTPSPMHLDKNEVHEINYCSGAACLLKTEVLKKTGLFNERFFMYHEDLDLGWRFSLLGYHSMIEPGAVVFHKYEFSRSIRKYYFMERNRFLTIFQNYKLATLLLILPALLMMEAGLLLTSVRGGWFKEKIRVYRYFLSLRPWLEITATRKKIQSGRLLSDGAVVKKFSGVIRHQELPSQPLDKIANLFFNCYWQIVKLIIVW